MVSSVQGTVPGATAAPGTILVVWGQPSGTSLRVLRRTGSGDIVTEYSLSAYFFRNEASTAWFVSSSSGSTGTNRTAFSTPPAEIRPRPVSSAGPYHLPWVPLKDRMKILSPTSTDQMSTVFGVVPSSRLARR
ncbi:MAG: hypothetical protein L0H03_03480 [Rhodococcus sp. (in: high G+C Gram-positive bacteria)]|nr:hypothetical protein [Rhodococcus sp. (in: high G+C Gram-positive bacteria)]